MIGIKELTLTHGMPARGCDNVRFVNAKSMQFSSPMSVVKRADGSLLRVEDEPRRCATQPHRTDDDVTFHGVCFHIWSEYSFPAGVSDQFLT